jgi:hypothetical protein
MATPEQNVSIKVDPKVAVGLSSVAGFAAAGVQYLGVIVGVLDDGALSTEELGLCATATATLIATIHGRFKQGAAARGW